MPQQFACGQCGKKYTWKAELAGKKVRCICGHVMTAPQAPAPEPEQEDLYDLADDPSPRNPPASPTTQSQASTLPIDDEDEMPIAPPRTAPKAPPAPIASNPRAQNLRPGGAPPLAARAGAGVGAGAGAAASSLRAYPPTSQRPGAARDELDNAVGGTPMTELYIPAILLGVGLMVFALSHMYQGGSLQSFGSVLPAIGLGLLFDLVLSFAGIFMVAKIWEVSFGAPGPAIVKLCTCAILPPALATLLGNWIGSDSFFVAMGARSILMMPLALFCFMLLFRLAIDEAIYCTVVIYIINEWVIRLLLSAILSTGAAGGLSSGGPGGSAPDTPAGRAFRLVQEDRGYNAADWLKTESHGISFAATAEARIIVDKLIAAGAKQVYLTVPAGESMADAMVIVMPGSKEKRAAVFELATRVAARFNTSMPDQTAADDYLLITMPDDVPAPLKNMQRWD